MRKEYKRSLIKFSNYSLCVTLPKTMLNKMSLDKGDEVNITLRRGKIIIEPMGKNSASKKATSGDDANASSTWEPLPEMQE
jgi:antitoxin component of MazEF toxin-antitoxin module